MAVEKELMHFRGDEDFRRGACHGAQWFLETSRTLASEGRSAEEIAAHLVDLTHILADWRSQTGELPDGNPWDWSYKDLACVIQARNAD